jgi:hypothetical protein
LRREGSGRAVRSVTHFATQYRTLGSLPCQTAPIPVDIGVSGLCTSSPGIITKSRSLSG